MATKEQGKPNKVHILGLDETTGTWSASMAIEGQTESSLNISNATTSVESTKDDAAGWKTTNDGEKSWGCDATFLRNADSANNVRQLKVLTKMLSSDTSCYLIQGEWKTETSGGSTTTKFYGLGGKVKITSLNTSYPKDSAVSAQASFEGDGAVLDFTAGKTASELKSELEAL